jgi:hypothetical protein
MNDAAVTSLALNTFTVKFYGWDTTPASLDPTNDDYVIAK